jgi:hypothetical protein
MLLVRLPLLLASSAGAEGWVKVGDAGECVATHPPQHRVEVVRDQFAKRDDLAAVEDAVRARAREALRQSVCSGRSAVQCDAIQAQTGIDVAVDLERRVVCAAALVSAGAVADPDGEQVHAAKVRTVAAELAQAMSGAPVGVVDVQWASGCGAGDAGGKLAAALRAGLAAAGGIVTDGAGDRVVAKLAPGDPVTVELWRYTGGGGALVASVQLAADWLGLFGSAGGQCHDVRYVGLEAGQRAGVGGLKASINFPSNGALCPGEQIEAVVRVSSSAQVQVWSVGRTGEAWLTWSSAESTGGLLDRRASLTLEAAHVPALGEEQLLVVAAPPSVPLAPLRSGCRVSTLAPFSDQVALASAPFIVLPPGRGRCPAGTDRPAVSWADYQSAPACK